MAITLDGTVGVTSPDFIPSSSNIPTNGLFLPAANALGFATNSTERLRLDASGNLGLGVTPSAWSLGKALDLGGGASILGYANYTYLSSNAYYNSGWKYIGSGNATYYQQNSGIHAWNTAPSGTAGAAISFTQAMTLDASGNLLLNTTSRIVTGKMSILFAGASDNGINLQTTNSSTGSAFLQFFNNSAASCGYIQQNGTTTVNYASSSDERLKSNIVDAPSALSSVNAIKIRSFDWKSDGSHVDYGYIAQELLEIVPEAVSIPADPEEMMGVDFGKLTPRLVKAIQELNQRLEALENK